MVDRFLYVYKKGRVSVYFSKQPKLYTADQWRFFTGIALCCAFGFGTVGKYVILCAVQGNIKFSVWAYNLMQRPYVNV